MDYGVEWDALGMALLTFAIPSCGHKSRSRGMAWTCDKR